jgi:hypothetical protein
VISENIEEPSSSKFLAKSAFISTYKLLGLEAIPGSDTVLAIAKKMVETFQTATKRSLI